MPSDTENRGKCAKQTVRAIIENNGKFYYGTNWCETPQETCPREGMPTGVGYELCKIICGQKRHADVDACLNAGENAKGGTMYLVGHYYSCDECRLVAKSHGIKKIVIGEYPKGEK